MSQTAVAEVLGRNVKAKIPLADKGKRRFDLRKILVVSLILFLSIPLMGQLRTGNIYGKVVDNEGNPLPGVAVTLTGLLTAPVAAGTSAEGLFRFLSLSPAKDYSLKTELQGFNTEIKQNIIVVVGANVNLTIIMKMSSLQQEVTVVAPTPVVDAKTTTVGMNVTQDILQSIPSARDPWVIIQMAPAVIIDRDNVGGNESGHQSLFVARGSSGRGNNSFILDGVDIQSPQSSGSSTIYFDLDAFEEMTITTGGSDVTSQTGGVVLNMVTRRGGNKLSLAGRFYLADQLFQAENITAALKAEGLPGINKIRRNQDYGFNIGGPLIKDKVWFWGSYGIGEIKMDTIFALPDDTTLTNVSAKINLQILPQNRFEAFASGADKYKYGGGSSSSNPTGIIQLSPHRFGVPILKFQDEHMFGDNLFASVKYSWSDNSGGHVQVMDPTRTNLAIYDAKDQRWYQSMSVWQNKASYHQFHVLLSYFNDKLLGMAHEFKLGFENRAAKNLQEAGVYNGNMYVTRNYNTPQVDFNGDSLPDIPTSANFKGFRFQRGAYNAQATKAYAGFFSDTITIGRFNAILGLRFDRQIPFINAFTIKSVIKDAPVWMNYVTPKTTDILNTLLPGIDVPAVDATAADGSAYTWDVWSPRLGLTYDLNGDGKTIVKLSLSRYGDYMGLGEAGRWAPGGGSGWMNFWWQDNGNGVIDYSELYWSTVSQSPKYQLYPVFDAAGKVIGNWADAAGTFWGGYDNLNPLAMTKPYQSIDSEAGSSRTSEAILTVEREIFEDFSLALNLSYRRYDNNRWSLKYFPATGVFQDQSWYVSAGNPPADIPGIGNTKEAKNHPWYYTSATGTAYSPYSWVKKTPDLYNDFYGVDLVFNKRLSHKWLLTGSLSWGKQEAHYGSKGFMNPNNLWAYEGNPYSPLLGGGSGKIDQYILTRWMFKLSGLYQLPYGFNASFTCFAREGYIIKESFQIVDYRLPNSQSNSATLDMTPFGENRLPNSFLLNVRLEKMLKISDTATIYLMADAFNALNSATVNRREQKYYGAYYVYPDSAMNRFVPNINNYKLNDILNPRIFRFGVRFTI